MEAKSKKNRQGSTIMIGRKYNNDGREALDFSGGKLQGMLETVEK